jgi:hypothetical protein
MDTASNPVEDSLLGSTLEYAINRRVILKSVIVVSEGRKCVYSIDIPWTPSRVRKGFLQRICNMRFCVYGFYRSGRSLSIRCSPYHVRNRNKSLQSTTSLFTPDDNCFVLHVFDHPTDKFPTRTFHSETPIKINLIITDADPLVLT